MNMYNQIEIHKTEYSGKYLLITKSKTLYVGFIVKDVLDFLKCGFNNNTITLKINEKHNTDLSSESVNNIKASIDKFLINEEKSNLHRLLKLFNPNKILIPKIAARIFFKKYFYFFLITSLVFNIVSYMFKPIHSDLNSYQYLLVFSAILVILIFHEIGHSISAKGFNIDVNEIGFGLYYIFPVLYVDLNQSWILKKKKRIIINLSGIYIQLLIGTLLVFISYFVNDKEVIMSIFKINFYIILLNLNPFFKFDGYWVLSDWLGENNLMKKSKDLVRAKFKTNKFKELKLWIFFYTILRVVFLTYIIFMVSKSFILIIKKIFSDMSLTASENIFIIIAIFFITKLIFTKIKASKDELKTRKG